MTPLLEKLTNQTPPHLREFVDAALHEVCHSTYQCIQPHFFPVWGVIWLIQAIIFFALGVIVGLVAFKVRFLHFTNVTATIINFSLKLAIGGAAED